MTARSVGTQLATGEEQKTCMSSVVLNDTTGLKPKEPSVVDVPKLFDTYNRNMKPEMYESR